MLKHHDQKKLGEEKVYFSLSLVVCHPEKSCQGLTQWPWMGAAYLFASNGFLSLFSYSTQDHQPRGGMTRINHLLRK